MKGLLLKDFYMARKYCRAYVVIAVVFSLLAVWGNTSFLLAYPVLLTDNEIQNLIFLVGFLTEIRPNFLKSFCLTTKLPKDESLLLYEDILLYLDN